MAQTRLEKIGTIYSRMSGLLRSGAMKAEHKPVWFEVYEAFPPKYEPRFDRHQLPYGEGGNVEAMGPPRKIFYKEDLIRAKFYKVFFPHEGADSEEVEKVKEVFNLMDNETEPLSEKFIAKYQQLQAKGTIPEDKLFRAAVDAMELDGIRLLTASEVVPAQAPEEPEKSSHRRPHVTLKELFSKDGSSEK